MMRETTGLVLLGVALTCAGCEVAEAPVPTGNGVCDAPALEVSLPAALEETSGVAASHSYPGVFWTHNDSGGEPAVYAVDSTGTVLARVTVRNASNRDWEDIAIGPCEPGSPDACLWVAETGDNNERHAHVAVYRVEEPDPATDTATEPASIFRFAYPDGARDAEALFVTDAGVHVINKGRSDAIELFRLPPPYPADHTATLETVQRLAPPPTSVSAQVTAAAVDPEGGRVAVRTYGGLRFYRVVADTLEPVGRPADIVAPGQLQGEGLDFLADDRYVVTGEAQGPRPATLAHLTCDPERPPPDTVDPPS